jgi:hypothetical protein
LLAYSLNAPIPYERENKDGGKRDTAGDKLHTGNQLVEYCHWNHSLWTMVEERTLPSYRARKSPLAIYLCGDMKIRA